MMGQVPGPGDDESLKESVPGLFRSGEMMRHLKLSIEQEVVRAIEGVDLAEIRRCYRDQDEFVVVDGPPVAASAGDSDRDPSGWPMVLAVKLGLVAILLLSTLTHDLIIGPRVGRIVQLPTKSRTRFDHTLVLWSPWVARFSLILALSVLFAAVMLVRS